MSDKNGIAWINQANLTEADRKGLSCEPLTVGAQTEPFVSGWKPEDTKGGDMILRSSKPSDTEDGQTIHIRAGLGWGPDGKLPLHGRIRFELPTGIDILRIEGDGKVYVFGVLEREDKSIVDAFSKWLVSSMAHYDREINPNKVSYAPANTAEGNAALLVAADEFALKVERAEDARDLYDDAMSFVEVVRKACGGKP